MTRKKFNSSSTEGAYEVGYARPPKSGQIKPGEVRNPWGRTGKRERAEDLLLKVTAEKIQASVNGKAASMTQEEAVYRRLHQDALRGNPTAMKLVMEHLSRRRPPLPPHPTMEELAQEAADEERRKELSGRLVRLLEEKAAMKREGYRMFRVGPDGRPIFDEARAEFGSAGPLDQPVKQSGG